MLHRKSMWSNAIVCVCVRLDKPWRERAGISNAGNLQRILHQRKRNVSLVPAVTVYHVMSPRQVTDLYQVPDLSFSHLDFILQENYLCITYSLLLCAVCRGLYGLHRVSTAYTNKHFYAVYLFCTLLFRCPFKTPNCKPTNLVYCWPFSRVIINTLEGKLINV